MNERAAKQRLVVPDLVGLLWEAAVSVLEREGFENWRLHYAESYEPVDEVIAQHPPKGHLVPCGEELTLTVSKRSLVRFLPSVYQSGGPGREEAFLKRFLWVFQHILDSVDTKIRRIHENFSPTTADEDFLPWLAQWFGLTLDTDWPEARKRALLREAAGLYHQRGTVAAISALVRLFTDVEPEIRENEWPHEGLRVGVHSTMGVDTVIMPPVNKAHCFLVRLPRSYEELGEERVARVHKILRAEKPAHTMYCLEFASPEGERA